MADHPKSAVDNFRVIFHGGMSTNEAQIREGHKANLFFSEPLAVVGSIWQRVGY
jgi:hypothetical protein